jgi:hypothetical protein
MDAIWVRTAFRLFPTDQSVRSALVRTIQTSSPNACSGVQISANFSEESILRIRARLTRDIAEPFSIVDYPQLRRSFWGNHRAQLHIERGPMASCDRPSPCASANAQRESTHSQICDPCGGWIEILQACGTSKRIALSFLFSQHVPS